MSVQYRVSRSFWLFWYLIGVSAKLDAYLDFSIVTNDGLGRCFITASLYRLFASGIVNLAAFDHAGA